MILQFRNDDVNANSNFEHIKEIYYILEKYFPSCEIYSAITILSEKKYTGKPYFNNGKNPFLVNRIFDFKHIPDLRNIVSHGLFHDKHGRMSNQAQKMSILSSCELLGTKEFLPPFNEWNEYTIQLCEEKGITIIGDSEYNNKVRKYLKKPLLQETQEKWKNFETERFDKNFQNWLFHSWKFTPKSFEEKLLDDLIDNNSI